MTARKIQPATLTAGQRLIAELAQPNDPYSLTFLIEQAADVADYLAKLRELITGDRSTWLSLKLGAKTVEVIVNDPLREARQQGDHFRKLLAAILSQRAAIPMPPDRNDDLAGLT